MQTFDFENLVLSHEDWAIVSSAFAAAGSKPDGPAWRQRLWGAFSPSKPAPHQPDEREAVREFVARSRYLRRPADDLSPMLSSFGFTGDQITALAALATH